MTTGLPIKDYVPQIVLRGDSQEKLLAAREYIQEARGMDREFREVA